MRHSLKINGKIKWLFNTIVLLATLLAQDCFAQQIIWANKNKLDKRTDFTKVVGQNRFGVYVLKHKNSNFRRYYILEHFDKKMNLLKSKTFRIPNAELEKIVVHSGGITVFTREYIKGRFSRLLWQNIDSAMNESAAKAVFGNSGNESEISNIRIEYSLHRDKFLLWYLMEENEKTKLYFHLLSRTAKIREGSAVIDRKPSDLFIGDALTDDSGNLYVLYTRSSKFKSKLAADFEHRLLALNTSDLKEKDLLINNPETFFSSYKLSFNPDFQTVTAFGLTGQTDEDDNKGYFTIRMRCSDFKVISNEFTDIDRKMVAQVIGIKNEQKGEALSKFKIKKLIPKTDGGLMAICERMFITTQSEIFYVNGIPQSSYARIFNNDEVMVLNLDSNGVPLWSDIITKNQSSVNDGGYFNGIVIMVNEDDVVILYNDKISANADIIQITYKADGSHNKKILMNNEQFYALVIPSEYNQVSANSIVIPVTQNRDYTYIKILY